MSITSDALRHLFESLRTPQSLERPERGGYDPLRRSFSEASESKDLIPMKRLAFLLSPIFILFLFVSPSPVSASSVVINEFLPNPLSDEDWVELYNSGTETIDINDWYLRDEATTHIADFSSLSIAPGTFLAVDVGTRLNKDEDTVKLFDSSDVLIDSQPYHSNPGDGISIGRYPDGSSSWVSLQNPTKGSSNGTSTPLPSPTPTTPPPTDTPAPTKTPSPTKTPTPSRTPTPEIIPTDTPRPSPSSSQRSPTKKPTPAVLGEETSESDPTINLDVVDATNHETATPTGELAEESRAGEREKNKGAILPLLLIIIGGILTLGFGTPLAIQELRSRRKKA